MEAGKTRQLRGSKCLNRVDVLMTDGRVRRWLIGQYSVVMERAIIRELLHQWKCRRAETTMVGGQLSRGLGTEDFNVGEAS